MVRYKDIVMKDCQPIFQNRKIDGKTYIYNFFILNNKTMITICEREYSTNITELCLSRRKLTTIPEEIKYLTNLRFLDLSCNEITAIPEHIFDNLLNLRELYLSWNHITAIPGHIFDNLINLRELFLSENQITAIPEHIFDNLINLDVLSLSNNNLTVIPEHLFDNLIDLGVLSLSNNKLTAIPDHLFDILIKLEDLSFYNNQITAIPISILNCRLLGWLQYHLNPIKHMDIRILRFVNNIKNAKSCGLFNDSQNVHSSIKESINSLMRDPFTMDKDVMIKQLIEESPTCQQSLLCYLDDKDVHSTLYLTFFEVFVKVWGRIIGSDFKAALIKRLDDEMMDSECKCLTDRISHLLNVLVGFFTDINITTSNSERIGAIILSVLNGREMTDELKEICRKSLKEAEIEDDEIGKWLDIKILL
jgi:hypothetical protein